jgi:EPS-associated MarR family transcriptional regulator
MNNKDLSDELVILRKINSSNPSTQRQLAKVSGFSLGKLNYCIKALKKKGYVKYENFKSNNNKFGYFYILTPKGISHKTRLVLSFMNKKMLEYEELKKEINN